MIRTILLTGAGAAALLGALPAAAQETGAQQTAPSTSEVVVTGKSLEDTLPETLSRTGVKVDVITDKEVRQGGYIDVAQSLQAMAPGLYLQPKNGPFDYVDISLLGSRTEDVLFLVDGVRINNRLYAGTTPLDTLPSAIIDRIEVLEGGQSLFYGTQAVAGAVNIVTKPFTNQPDGQAMLAADSNGGRHVDAYYRGAIGKNLFVAYGSVDKSDGYQAFRNQDYQPSATDRNRSYDVITLGGKYAYYFTSNLRFSASYQHTDADLDYALPYRVAKDTNDRQEDLATAKIDWQATDQLAFFLKGYYHNWRTKYDTYYNDLANPGNIIVLYQDTPWRYNDAGLNALGKYVVKPGIEAWFGYDYQSYGGQDAVLVIAPNHEDTHAVFGQLRLTPDLIPNAHLAAGFRYNHPSEGQSATIWNVSGQYDLPAGLFIRGEGGTNFRLPTAEELFANDPLDERGNPNLKPETSESINLSFGGQMKPVGHAVRWEITGFARNVKNLIDYDTFDPVTQQDVFGNVSGTVKVRGAEVQVNADLTDALGGTISYTHNSSKLDGGQQLDRVPKDLVKASLDWHPRNLPFGSTLDIRYTGDTSISIAGVEHSYGDYTVVDWSGRYFIDQARRMTFNLSIQNLLDQSYGTPGRGCQDVATDGPYDCSSSYIFVNRGLPRTFRGSFTFAF
jgi:outer membrane cobalamin receptor